MTSIRRHRSRRASRRCARRGAALVEFALLAPVFVALVLGVAEMGNALDTSTRVIAAVRQGGRLASMDWSKTVAQGQSPNDKIIADIRNILAAEGIPADKVDIKITAAEGSDSGKPFNLADPANSLRLFKITAKIAYKDSTAYPAMLMKGRDITGSLVFRAGRVQLVQ